MRRCCYPGSAAHVAGGAAVWIVRVDYSGQGTHPMGMEPVAVGVSSDAYHIITPPPTAADPAGAVGAGARPEDIGS